MPTINKLPAIDVVSSGDQIPVYSPNLGDARRMSVSTLSQYIEDNVIVPNNAANVTYDPAGGGAVATNVQAKLRERVSVLDFGADPTGVADSTTSFNLATKAAAAYNRDVEIEIDLGGGYYKVLGTVYVRKGQKIRGGGAHLFMSSTGSMKLGFNSSNVEDSGGSPIWVDQVWFEGGLAPINALVNGYYITDCFFSSSATGPFIGGTDAVVANCIFDDGSTLLSFNARNTTLVGCNFYRGNNQISIGTGDHNTITGCAFHYAAESSIKWDDNTHRSLRVNDCVFMQNAQFPSSFRGFIYTGGGAAIAGDITVSDCSFRNCYSGAVRLDAATANYRIDFLNCVFDGDRTNSAYTQSTTMLALDMATGGSSKGLVSMKGCTFRNLHQTPIQIGGNESWNVSIYNGEFTNNTGTRSIEVAGTNAAAIFSIGNIVGDGKNLIDFTSTGSLRVNGWLKRWLTETVSGSDASVRIPFSGPVLLDVTLVACANPAGNVNYRTVKNNLASLSFDYTGGNFITQVSNSSVFNSTSPLGFSLTLNAELNSVGGGTQVAGLNAPGHVVLSTLSSYGDRSWDVQYKHAENI